jgi:hypothetical protein
MVNSYATWGLIKMYCKLLKSMSYVYAIDNTFQNVVLLSFFSDVRYNDYYPATNFQLMYSLNSSWKFDWVTSLCSYCVCGYVAMTGRRASAEARRAPPGVVGAASAAAGEEETWRRGQRRSRGCPSDIGAISVRVAIVLFLGVTPSSRTSGMRHKISPSTQILHGCLRLPRSHPPHVATGSALVAEFSNILAL